jgi:uncharacterized membrane protein
LDDAGSAASASWEEKVSDRIVSTTPPLAPVFLRSLAISAAIAAAALAPILSRMDRAHLAQVLRPPHLPDLAPIQAAPLAIQLHLAAIGAATVVGVVLVSGVKGTRLHRVLGWSWASFIVFAAVSALFIQAPTGLPSLGGIGLLHVFSGVAIVTAPLGVLAARRHDVTRHARIMTGLFVGGLGVAGLFAFLPGRLMWTVFFG